MQSRLYPRVLGSAGWTAFSFGASSGLRLFGSIILTRLLFPEAFGLMAIVTAVIVGLHLLSDVGLEQSIIQNPEGHKQKFLDTAWSVKVVRGVILWLVTCIAAIPLSHFYGQPMLAELLPIAGLNALLLGFSSTKLAIYNRDLRLARPTILNLVAAVTGLGVTIAWAYVERSVWALVVGNLAGTMVFVVGSHTLLPGPHNRISFDRESISHLSQFGRWILISSLITFATGEGNRLLIGAIVDVSVLGFFSLAINISQIPLQAAQQIGGRVFFAAYAEILRLRPEALPRATTRSRMALIIPYWAVSALLLFVGKDVIALIYDDRYADAGWILQALAAGSLIGCLTVSYGGLLWARGLVKTSTLITAVQLVVQLVAIVLGGYLAGAKGIAVGLASVSWISYPIAAAILARLRVWEPRIDIPVVGLSTLVLTMFLLVECNYF